MARGNHQGHSWAVAAGLNAALAAVSAKFFASLVQLLNLYPLLHSSASFQILCTIICHSLYIGSSSQETPFAFISFDPIHSSYQTSVPDIDVRKFLRYGLVLFFNVTMWGCYINSLKALSSLQATVTNFATNFLSSGVAGFFLFQESLPSRWFAGAFFIIIGVFILSKSNIEKKPSQD
ncbi:uncharacterized protein LOC110101859 isoform X1 [Dendrobium catenatum]|uniref:uncharacterized protein LOC110101859 isoform X1 n=1 Tax=Dendrobium catenatum TaxID=906689 RepID=UPI0009F6A2C5|nr:uncharacterized protein LOC110101859 isoform X1 [Dendrobium catenatum]